MFLPAYMPASSSDLALLSQQDSLPTLPVMMPPNKFSNTTVNSNTRASGVLAITTHDQIANANLSSVLENALNSLHTHSSNNTTNKKNEAQNVNQVRAVPLEALNELGTEGQKFYTSAEPKTKKVFSQKPYSIQLETTEKRLSREDFNPQLLDMSSIISTAIDDMFEWRWWKCWSEESLPEDATDHHQRGGQEVDAHSEASSSQSKSEPQAQRTGLDSEETASSIGGRAEGRVELEQKSTVPQNEAMKTIQVDSNIQILGGCIRLYFFRNDARFQSRTVVAKQIKLDSILRVDVFAKRKSILLHIGPAPSSFPVTNHKKQRNMESLINQKLRIIASIQEYDPLTNKATTIPVFGKSPSITHVREIIKNARLSLDPDTLNHENRICVNDCDGQFNLGIRLGYVNEKMRGFIEVVINDENSFNMISTIFRYAGLCKEAKP
eukprot:GDKK01003949.1.p1 GENE.GDKK01003949.1~~GDKK01003949.1.p1  ORF type:complete len:438 (+),score=76.29 GDKK01003949.1:423-1736(+)